MLALLLGLVVSTGLYFAYMWPSVEPAEELPQADSEPAAAQPLGEPADQKTEQASPG